MILISIMRDFLFSQQCC